MSAARVLNPVTDFCKIRAGVVNRNLPTQLNRIKRDLFGAANPVETNKIFTEELEKHQDKAIKKWGFDFRNGSPMSANTQYIWERVSFQESSYAPEMYTLTRAAHVRPACTTVTTMDLLLDERAERENYMGNISSTSSLTDTDSCDDSHDDEIVFKVPTVAVAAAAAGGGGGGGSGGGIGGATGSNATGNSTTTLTLRLGGTRSAALRKRQPKITEYMKERKRLAQTPKKASPAKRMRTSSGSSSRSNNSSSVSHSAHAHSISSHFMLRSQRHN